MTQPSMELSKKVKKPYEPPKLLVYGDLKEMTRTIGTKGQMDGGTGSPLKRRTGR
jgi:hypothetical protein